MQKEIFTKENCQTDIIKRINDEIFVYAVHSVFWILTSLLLGFVIYLATHLSWLLVLIALLPIPYPVYKFIQLSQSKRKAQKCDFEVIEAELVRISEHEPKNLFLAYPPMRSSGFFSDFYALALYFSNCGRYIVPHSNYTWSKTFDMSRDGIKNTSLLGDTFYVVILNGDPIYAYNKRFFEYKEA